MMPTVIPASLDLLWAVHISDGVLAGPWLAGGFVVAGLLAVLGAWRMREEEIPRVAVMTSAFFIASLMHVKVPGTSVHLLLNGLVGVVLGRRAAVAIPVGLLLQELLIGHGGFSTLGINSCIMVLPALLAWLLFAALQRLPWLRQPWFRTGLILMAAPLWVLSLVYTIALLASNLLLGHRLSQIASLHTEWADRITLHPLVLVVAVVLGVLAALLERRLDNAPEFALGLLIGGLTVLATVLLNAIVLLFGSLQPEAGPALALVMLALHLPVVVIEGVVLGFTVGFLARVKPEMLGWKTVPVVAGPQGLAAIRLVTNRESSALPVKADLSARAESRADPLI
jgi:cobalt/nickel transport system permease protein